MPRLIALLLSWLLVSGAASAAEPVFPPGSRIGLVPPADMTMSRGLTGFRNPKSGAAILAVEMPPEAFATLAAGFSDEGLKAQGFSLKARDIVPVGGGTAVLITGEQSDNGRSIPKTVLLSSQAGMTALVLGQLPPGSAPEEIASVEAALRTVAFRPPLSLDEQIAALPFRIGDTASFRPVRAIAGNSLLLTDGPSDVIREAAQPVLIVAHSFAPPPHADLRESFARQALVSNSFIREATLERSQSYRQGGSNWHEILAKAKETGSGTPVIVMQTIRFEPDGYVRSVGIVREDARDAMLPRFRQVVDSLQVQVD